MINHNGQFNNNTNPFEGREGLVYARVSSKKQETDGSGLQSQEGRCISYLESNGIPHTKSFADSFTGGGDFMRRPAMRELFNFLDANPHRKFVVVFDDLKRFARDTVFHFKLRNAFRVRDVVLKCLNYNFEDSPEGNFNESIYAAQGQLEREQNRRQVIQKQTARLEAGYWAFGARKGYSMKKDGTNGCICIPNKEGQYLKTALENFADGKFVHIRDGCNFLAEKGFWKGDPAKRHDLFKKMLKDPFYAGFIEYLPRGITRRIGKHKPIISLDTFEANQKRLSGNDSGKKVRKDMNPDFWMRGLILCDYCKKHIGGCWSKGRSKKYPYYFCQNSKCAEYQKSIPVDMVHSQFLEALKKHKLSKEDAELLTKRFELRWNKRIANLEESKATTERKKKELEKKLEELSDLMISSRSDAVKKVYERQIESHGRELERLENINFNRKAIDLNIPYQTALDKATVLLKSPYSIWLKFDVREQHKLFYFLFDEKLLFSKKEGYQTAENACVITAFKDFAVQNPNDVQKNSKTLNRIKDYLMRFWNYYNSNPLLKTILK